MLFLIRTLLSLGLMALGVFLAGPARGITVSGRVTESDTGPVSGVTITIEQVGGELPPFTTQTGPDGRWALSDPLLTGNVRVTPSSSSFRFSPVSRDSFTFADLSSQNFTAEPTVPRANITVLRGDAPVILSGGPATFGGLALGVTLVPAFLIRNDGTLPLNHISVTITGAPPGEFTVDQAPATSLEPGAVTLLAVGVTPVAEGLRSATILIHSDDPNEDPFVVELSGRVLSLEVTNTADSGPGSLRQAILNTVVTEADDTIRFHSSLSGQTITLSREIPVDATGSVVVDATTLPGGLRLSGGGSSRIFNAGLNALKLLGLTLTDGRGPSADVEGSGGSVLSKGELVLSGCTFSNNVSSVRGGAVACIERFSTLTVSNCTFLCNTGHLGGAIGCDSAALIHRSTFACNSGNFGGALHFLSDAQITHCTLTGNNGNGGGAIVFSTGLILDHCTISGNRANSGGGIFSRVGGTVECNFSILTGNVPDDLDPRLVALDAQGSLLQGPPLLAPLDDYGGPTKTMALLPGSPARNAATNSTSKFDQRGFPIVGVRDIGAYEAGTDSNFNAFIWEHLPPGTTAQDHGTGVDFDGDGADNLSEWLALTDPADASSTFRILRIASILANAVEVTFSSSLGRHYQVSTSANLIDWVAQPSTIPGTGSPLTVPVRPGAESSHHFLRILAFP